MIESLLEPLVPEKFRTDERYRIGHIRIINALPGRRILGVHTPEMRALAKELARRDDALDIIAGFEDAAALEQRHGRGCEGGLCYEETVVWGMMINAMKFPGPSVHGKAADRWLPAGCGYNGQEGNIVPCLDLRLEMTRRHVSAMDNWAVCDMFDSGAKWFGRLVSRSLTRDFTDMDSPFPACRVSGRGALPGGDKASCPVGPVAERLWKFLCAYFASDREFEVRFATVMSMSHFMNERYLPRIFYRFDSLDFSRIRSEYISPAQARAMGNSSGQNIKDDRQACGETDRVSGTGIALGEPPYYVRMGVAWCLATALAKFPDDTRAYLRHSRLPEDVIRLYVRKARESFRTRNISPF